MAIKISGSTIIDDSRNIVSGAGATFTGNVSVGGTLTYEDVTNVDSIGIITARQGIRIGAGYTVGPVSGIVTYYGDGSGLTGLAGFAPDDYGNLYAGTESGETSGSGAIFNIGLGACSLHDNSTGDYAVAIGFKALCKALEGCHVAIGQEAGASQCYGNHNVYIGACVASNTSCNNSSNHNIGLGFSALKGVTSGSCNIALGYGALQTPSTSSSNFAVGRNALSGAVTGSDNISIGRCSSMGALTGSNNIALGCKSGSAITSGGDNVFLGRYAGKNLTTGNNNIMLGRQAGVGASISQYDSIFIGSYAGRCSEYSISGTNGCGNIFIGSYAGEKVGQAGDKNVFIGHHAGKCMCAKCVVAIGCGAATGTGGSGVDHIVAIGRLALNKLTTGTRDTAIGDGAGYKTTSGSSNFFGGYTAGYNNTVGSHNTFIGGNRAGCYNRCGGCNIFIGSYAGRCNQDSCCNTIVGSKSACCADLGCSNTILGQGIAQGDSFTGSINTIIGQGAGLSMTSGGGNVFLGHQAGNTNTSGGANIAIGCDVELPSATGSCQLAIGRGTDRWITGDSSFNVVLAGIATVTKSGGIFAATKFCGDGSCLTGISAGWEPDDQENLYAGTGAGAASDGDT